MNFLNHLKTINKHRRVVRYYCFKLHLYWQGLTHDLSKYSFTEFSLGVKYYQGFRSPHEKERKEYGYSKAWMHHKGRNKHHFEYWTDIDKESGLYKPYEMPLKYVKEMLCDRIAASKIYKKDEYTDASPYDYFLTSSARLNMHPNTAKLIEEWLLMLKEKGEEYTFNYINHNYK